MLTPVGTMFCWDWILQRPSRAEAVNLHGYPRILQDLGRNAWIGPHKRGKYATTKLFHGIDECSCSNRLDKMHQMPTCGCCMLLCIVFLSCRRWCRDSNLYDNTILSYPWLLDTVEVCTCIRCRPKRDTTHTPWRFLNRWRANSAEGDWLSAVWRPAECCPFRLLTEGRKRWKREKS